MDRFQNMWPIRMCCLPYKIVTSFTNFHATTIVGMWAALPKDYKTESIHYGTSFSKQFLPIHKCKYSIKSTTQIQYLMHDSAIGLHHQRNPTCAQHYDDSMFSILARNVRLFLFQLLKPSSL